MRQYEITFIIDPVLPGDEIQTVGKAYEKLLTNDGCQIVHVDEMGLRQLAYPINRRNSGVYKSIEFTTETGAVIPKIELAMRRDERIMRFLSVKLDKYGVKYNDDNRNGRIGKKPKTVSSGPVAKEEVKKEDLTLIEGIGPKIAQLLNTAGIKSYEKLAASSYEDLKSILSKGGPSYVTHDPATWAEQSQLAAAGKWAELNTLKDKLIGKISPASSEEE
ncbi:MAG: 30S ribosomal protein S6 [Saprospiraceae bacterium]|nr:30S ribosomal protein S6 [Bacteroidia bacterium]MBT8229663.1 30S ribosomal protein S6 [Bacteroidia bacterium]NNF22094.1 30S ribosomal protein S6 [Saprospiraceae bacterium]NNK89424.1 30S ribosomal protein S6 [Saprospiraceae bacterium]